MADKDFSFRIENGFDFIIEEGGNTSINLRRGSWGEGKVKLDLRKWSYKDGEERAMKGCTLSDEGGNELAAVLCENGYGDTKRILKGISTREDFEYALKTMNEPDAEDNNGEDTEYYDPKELFSTNEM